MLNCRKVGENIALEQGIHFLIKNQLPFKDSFQFFTDKPVGLKLHLDA